jgi:hypothetical protein
MVDFKKLAEEARARRASGEATPRGGKALVAFFHERELLPTGGGYVLCYDADADLVRFISDGGGTEDGGFAIYAGGIDYDSAVVRAPGVYVGRLKFEDAGEGDYPGTREALVMLYDIRPATPAEWKSHLDGEWPWEDAFS